MICVHMNYLLVCISIKVTQKWIIRILRVRQKIEFHCDTSGAIRAMTAIESMVKWKCLIILICTGWIWSNSSESIALCMRVFVRFNTNARQREENVHSVYSMSASMSNFPHSGKATTHMHAKDLCASSKLHRVWPRSCIGPEKKET